MHRENNRFEGVRLLIFDLDGTLIDSEADLALSVNATREQMGMGPLSRDVIASYVGRGVPTLVRRALGAGISEAALEQAVAFFLDYYRAHMLDHTDVYPGVREALEALNGHRLAVLTNKPVNFSREILEGLKIASRFAFIYGGNSFERKKPDPVGVFRLMRDTGVGAHETMIIGDSETDVETGRNAGTWTCGVTYGIGSRTLARARPDLTLDNLEELPALLDGHGE
ncbi:MAG: HAD family hydrolase [Terriglobia bacterium]